MYATARARGGTLLVRSMVQYFVSVGRSPPLPLPLPLPLLLPSGSSAASVAAGVAAAAAAKVVDVSRNAAVLVVDTTVLKGRRLERTRDLVDCKTRLDDARLEGINIPTL
jgi:hypothetical protein